MLARLALGAGLATVALGLADPARADAPPAIEEITVTARRRAEPLLRVPVSIAAFGATELERRGLERSEDLVQATPQLAVSTGTFRRNQPIYQLRSINPIELSLSQDPTVGVYFGDVIQMRPAGMNQQLYDLEDVQVLLGPQGTLFGRNTTGGAILLRPKRPTQDFEAELSTRLGSFGRHDVRVIGNLPAGERLAFRAAFQSARRAGYTKNIVDGRDLDDEHANAWRFSALWQPSARFSNTLVYDGFDAHENGTALALHAARGPCAEVPTPTACLFGPPDNAALGTGDVFDALARQRAQDVRHVESDVSASSDTQMNGVANTSRFALQDGLALVNVAGWRDVETRDDSDFDGSALPIGATRQRTATDQLSDELRLEGRSLNGALDWLAGAYYFRERGTDESDSRVLDFAFNPSNPFTTGGQARNTSTALFAQGTWSLPWIEGLRATAGYRHTWDRRQMTVRSANNPDGVPPNPTGDCRVIDPDTGAPLERGACKRTVRDSFENPSWTLSLEYPLASDVFGYVAHRRGFRSGGFNLRAETPAQFEPFDAESVRDVELGLKTRAELFGVPLSLQVAAYHAWYRDIQREVAELGPGGVVLSRIVNATSAHVPGGELQLVLAPLPGLELSGFYGFSDARYGRFVTPEGDVSGRWLGGSKHTGGAALRFAFPFERGGELVLGANLYAASKSRGGTPIPEREGLEKPYTVLNLRADWNGALDLPFDVGVFVTNATDEEYRIGTLDLEESLGFTSVTFAEPRMFGVELTWSFSAPH